MDKVTELKAKIYDSLVQLETWQAKLNGYKQELAQIAQAEGAKDGAPAPN